MTFSESGFGEHPEIDDISAFVEGQLADDNQQALVDHLDTCASCADIQASLENVRELLAEAPDPGPMPVDVSERIAAALSKETFAPMEAAVSRETAASSDRGPDSGDTPRSSTSPRRQVPDRPQGHPSGTSGPGRSTRRGRLRRVTLLTAAGAVGVLGLGSLLLPLLSEQSGNRTADSGASSEGALSNEQRKADGSGSDRALGRQVQKLLSDQATDASKSPNAAPRESSTADSPLTGDSATSLPSCITEGIGRDEKPLAADPNSPYKGRDTYLVVLPHPGNHDAVDAYVIDSRCATGAVQGPGKVLTQHTYPRK